MSSFATSSVWQPAPKFRVRTSGRFVTCRLAESITGKSRGDIRTRSGRQMLIDTGLTAQELMLAARFAGWDIEMKRLQAWCKPPLSGGDVAITIPEMAALLWAVERMQRVLQDGYKLSGETRERVCRHCGRGYQLTGYSVGETAVDELYCQCGELLQRVTGECVWAAQQNGGG